MSNQQALGVYGNMNRGDYRNYHETHAGDCMNPFLGAKVPLGLVSVSESVSD